MAGLVPDQACRLQATAFVQDAELSLFSRSDIIRLQVKAMAERALEKLMNDCIKTEGDYQGYRGQTLRLDVYVLPPEELHRIIAEARMQGERDALRWGRTFSILSDERTTPRSEAE